MFKSILVGVFASLSLAAFAAPTDTNHKCDAVYARAQAQYQADIQAVEDAYSRSDRAALRAREAAYAQAEADRKATVVAANLRYQEAIAGVTGDNSAGYLNEQVRIRLDAIDAANRAYDQQLEVAKDAYVDAIVAARNTRQQGITKALARYERVTAACFNEQP